MIRPQFHSQLACPLPIPHLFNLASGLAPHSGLSKTAALAQITLIDAVSPHCTQFIPLDTQKSHR
ncbi:hypothetical protein EMGBS1_04890 [Chloroflexota bacterium]|nr:hypothetical protein EMGBS1_04890 [Chloroflexota bacterium]